ncbi:MAG: hypothetical protein KGP28_08500 [Bdellovibrionales bacterium]|nr:hypothetical protein [Bdellovibrionales bacterium]
MVLFQLFLILFSPLAHSLSSDSELVAESLVPLLEQTVQNLDRHRHRHLNGGLSAIELSSLTAGERARFESVALQVFKEHHIDGRRTLEEFQRDPLVRDVREAFRSYSGKKISLESLMRSLIHEKITVEAFLNDPELGYRSFRGFSRSSK